MSEREVDEVRKYGFVHYYMSATQNSVYQTLSKFLLDKLMKYNYRGIVVAHKANNI